MKHCFLILLLALTAFVPLSACAVTAQGLAKLRLHNMNVDQYFQNPVEIALVEAASRGDTQRMHQAIANGADVNKVGKDGMAPLIWAVGVHPNLDGFKYLLAHGANPNTVTQLPKSFSKDRAYVIQIAYEQADPRFMKALLEAGADPNTAVGGKATLLFYASSDERLEQTELLIKEGADVNQQLPVYGNTPMEDAIDGDQYKAALLLLRSGADPTLKDSNGDSAISSIKSNRQRDKKFANELPGYPELIQTLKQKGYLNKNF